MKVFIYKIVLISTFCMIYENVQGQVSDWSVNAANYQYSMTFTAFLSVNGTVLTSVNDKVFAFVGDEVRGVSNVEYIESVDKYVTFLTVYANTNNEIINFKIYNSNTQFVEEVEKTAIFKIDESLGSVFQSYSISNSQLNNEAIFNFFGFMEMSAISTEILSDKINIILPQNTDLTNLTPEFTTSDNSKVFVNNILQETESITKDFTRPIVYEVLSEDEVNLNEYEVSVANFVNNEPITVIVSNSGVTNVNSVPISLDVTFSEVVSGFQTTSLLLENAMISSLITEDDKTYKVSLIPLSQGEFSIQVPQEAALDINNNYNEASNKISLTYDIVKPLITNVSIDEDEASWSFLVDFNEEVLNVDVFNFELAGQGSEELEILSIEKVSSIQYKLKVSGISEVLGTVSLKIKETNNITDISGNLLVQTDIEAYFLNNKKPITITANPLTKVYGTGDLELTYVLSEDLLEGERLNGSLNREEGEDVDNYVITSTLSNSKYNITFISSYLSITAKPITITANPLTKVYGAEDPELTYVLSEDLIGNDTLDGSLRREEGEDVGMYTIQIGDLTLGNNYNILFVEVFFEIIENPTAGIDNVALSDKINLYPCPVENFLNIKIDNEKEYIEVLIYNLSGKLVKQEKNIKTRIQLAGLSTGAYVLKIIVGEKVFIKQILKK